MDDKVHTKLCEHFIGQLLDISVLWLNLNPVSDNRQFLHLIHKLRIARITEFLLLTEALWKIILAPISRVAKYSIIAGT